MAMRQAQMSGLFTTCFLMVLPVLVGANSGFLHPSNGQILSSEQKSAVLAAIEDALGEKHRHATEVRLAPLEAMLAPTLNALPKNEYGKFGHKAARYALHRLFVQRHAWFVKGVELSANLSDANSTSMLQDGVPDQIQTLFESRLGSHGLDAHEVAVMAATLENLAHAESMERLRAAYKVSQVSSSSTSMDVTVADSLLDLYMAAYVIGMNLSDMTAGKQEPQRITELANAIYPGFNDIRSFVRRVRTESTSGRSTISSMDLTHVVTRIGDKYGRWQHYECEDLKKKLLTIEDDGTGRVSLSKFYGAALDHGHWQFSEAPDYLRALGALDETNPTNPRVIVTNYILAPSNCVASSSYYSVCCLDECEDLVDHLEREISAPAATPTRIAELVAAMPSSTTPANHSIPAHLLEKLDEVAAANDGLVPLHGRFFAQWMHHVYPRECPYPHMTGTLTDAVKLDEYEKKTGLQSSSSPTDMREYINGAEPVGGSSEIVWTDDDEHYVEQAPPRYSSMRSILRFFVFFIMAISTAVFVLHLSRTGKTEANWQALTKSHYV